MTVPATAHNVEAILQKLYEAKRNLEASGMKGNIVFVLVTASDSERRVIEHILVDWFGKKCGDLGHWARCDGPNTWSFYGVTITLITK